MRRQWSAVWGHGQICEPLNASLCEAHRCENSKCVARYDGGYFPTFTGNLGCVPLYHSFLPKRRCAEYLSATAAYVSHYMHMRDLQNTSHSLTMQQIRIIEQETNINRTSRFLTTAILVRKTTCFPADVLFGGCVGNNRFLKFATYRKPCSLEDLAACSNIRLLHKSSRRFLPRVNAFCAAS